MAARSLILVFRSPRARADEASLSQSPSLVSVLDSPLGKKGLQRGALGGRGAVTSHHPPQWIMQQ
eukprot:6243756-Pyramimonas_sp.AAC.1